MNLADSGLNLDASGLSLVERGLTLSKLGSNRQMTHTNTFTQSRTEVTPKEGGGGGDNVPKTLSTDTLHCAGLGADAPNRTTGKIPSEARAFRPTFARRPPIPINYANRLAETGF